MVAETLHDPFQTAERQREADKLGLFVFLGSEIMLFGALFAAALTLFVTHTREVERASAELHVYLGGLNTAVLLTSSLAVAIGVESARAERYRLTAISYAGAALLGAAFFGIKMTEYFLEYHEGTMPGTALAHFDSRPHELFMNLYFASTGLHAFHLSVGVVLLSGMAWRLRGTHPPTDAAVFNLGLYWHLVDVIWVFLYPVLYLTRG